MCCRFYIVLMGVFPPDTLADAAQTNMTLAGFGVASIDWPGTSVERFRPIYWRLVFQSIRMAILFTSALVCAWWIGTGDANSIRSRAALVLWRRLSPSLS